MEVNLNSLLSIAAGTGLFGVGVWAVSDNSSKVKQLNSNREILTDLEKNSLGTDPKKDEELKNLRMILDWKIQSNAPKKYQQYLGMAALIAGVILVGNGIFIANNNLTLLEDRLEDRLDKAMQRGGICAYNLQISTLKINKLNDDVAGLRDNLTSLGKTLEQCKTNLNFEHELNKYDIPPVDMEAAVESLKRWKNRYNQAIDELKRQLISNNNTAKDGLWERIEKPVLNLHDNRFIPY